MVNGLFINLDSILKIFYGSDFLSATNSYMKGGIDYGESVNGLETL